MRTERFKGALLATLVIASLMVPAISLLSVSPSSAAPEGLTPHAPIYIDGNAGFTAANDITSGSGTENDPYVIENWDISASTAHGIKIRNTTAYFVIRNCAIENGGYSYYGIYLDNVVYGRIDNNTCSNNSDGIFLYYSDNNLIYHNNLINNTNQAYSTYSNPGNYYFLRSSFIGSAHDIDKIPKGWPTDAQNTTEPQPPAGYEKGALSQNLDYQVVISDVPAYLWYNGCGPTAAGMIIGYWDEHGFDDLVSGSTQEQTIAVNDMISSSGNYDDYCVPIDYYPNLLPDKSEPPVGDEHANNCVADFMKTSQSYYGNYYGWSWFSDVDDALGRYVQMVAPHYKVTVFNVYWGTFTWDSFCDEIDENHPVELLVDTDGNGSTDHFVTAIGYGEQDGTPMYACLNTWDNLIHWYEFAQMSSGQPWGIYGATLFSLEKIGVEISPIYQDGPPKATLTYIVTVKNLGTENDNYDLTVSDDAGWGPTLSDNLLEVPAGENGQRILSVTVPENAPPCTEDTITVIVTSQADSRVKDNSSCKAHAISPKAEFSLVTLYEVRLDLNLYFENGSKLVVKFYTYGNIFENENVIETFTPPAHVEENESARHPEGIGVKKVRLDLTTDNTEDVISTIASFTVTRSILMGRLVDIYVNEWPFVSLAERGVLMSEIVDIFVTAWPFAPY